VRLTPHPLLVPWS